MSERYKTKDTEKAYFVTLTVVGWVDIFTRKEIKDIIVNSLQYCQQHKGLVLFGWCLMSSHLHLICHTTNNIELSSILRDFKKHTSREIIKFIQQGNESRKEWLIEFFSKACEHLKREQQFKVWQDGNQPKIIYSSAFFWEKLDYIHNNPVDELIVEKPEDYLYSSARNYADLHGLVSIVLETRKIISY